MLALFFTEVSNPLMTYRHILRNTGRRHTLAYEVSEVGFIFIYIAFRLFAIIPIVYDTLTCNQIHLLQKSSCVGLMILSIWTSFRMIQTLKNRYWEIQARKKMNISLNWFEPLSVTMAEKLEAVKSKELLYC